MLASFPTLAVSIIYCLWQGYRLSQLRHERVLRERVTFMLWAMAHELEEGDSIIAPWQTGPRRSGDG
jgi:hypothetical protein